MSDGIQLLLLFGGLTLCQMFCAAALLVMAFRSDMATNAPEGDEDIGEGGDGGAPRRPNSPIGGPPLSDAHQSRVRLRGPQRLADMLPSSARRRNIERPRPARERVELDRS